MRKTRILIPEPASHFVRVKCTNCNNEQVVYSNSTFPARCLACGTQLVYPRGGKAKIVGEVLRQLG